MEAGNSDNATGAVNQQERLDSYVAGSSTKKEVSTSQSSGTRVRELVGNSFPSSASARTWPGREILDLVRSRFGCGAIRENHRGTRDTTNSVRGAPSGGSPLQGHPHLRTEPAPEPQARGVPYHRWNCTSDGKGRAPHRGWFRAARRQGRPNERWWTLPPHALVVRSRILRDHMPSADLDRERRRYGPTCMATCRASQKCAGPRHTPEVTEVSVPIRCSRRRSEEGCP